MSEEDEEPGSDEEDSEEIDLATHLSRIEPSCCEC